MKYASMLKNEPFINLPSHLQATVIILGFFNDTLTLWTIQNSTTKRATPIPSNALSGNIEV